MSLVPRAAWRLSACIELFEKMICRDLLRIKTETIERLPDWMRLISCMRALLNNSFVISHTSLMAADDSFFVPA